MTINFKQFAEALVGGQRKLDKNGKLDKHDFKLLRKEEELDEAGAYQKDMDEKKPVFAQGVKGMKSKPFVKKFKSQQHYEKWADSDAAGDHEVHRVYQEGVEFEFEDLTLIEEDIDLETLDSLLAEGADEDEEEPEEKNEKTADKKADKLGRKRSKDIEFHNGEDDGKKRFDEGRVPDDHGRVLSASEKNKLGLMAAMIAKERADKQARDAAKAKQSQKVKEEVDLDEASHQATTTMKHVKNPTAGEKKAAKDIKPGIAGYRDRVAMLKSAEKDGRLKEELDEAINADNYHATSEPSQFGGHRPKVVHKTKGTTMYLGQASYKNPKAAASGAKAYLDAYERIGDKAASRAAWDHAKNHPDTLKENVELEEGEIIKTSTGVRHKGTYGSEYETDRDGNEKKKVTPPAEKRGRGRPKKGSDDSGNVKKYTFNDLLNRISKPSK